MKKLFLALLLATSLKAVQPTANIISAGHYQLSNGETVTGTIGGGHAGERSTNIGPYVHGSDLWIIEQVRTNVLANNILIAYKSTDAGLTWTAFDSANGPTPQGGGSVAETQFDTYSLGNKIYVLSMKGLASVKAGLYITTFGMDTQVWETPTTVIAPGTYAVVGPGDGFSYIYSFQLSVPVAGTFQILYSGTQFNATNTTWFNRYTAGAWGVQAQITDASLEAPYLASMFTDGAGTIQAIIGNFDLLAGGPEVCPLRYLTVSNAGVVSASQLVANNVYFSGTHQATASVGPGVIWNNKLIFPYTRLSGANRVAAVMIGDPAGAPVWSSVDVSAITSIASGEIHATNNPDGSLYVFYSVINGATSILQYNKNSGVGFGTDVVFYDSSLDVAGAVWELSISGLAAGTFRVKINVGNNDGYYLSAEAPAPTAGQNYIMSDNPNFLQATNFIRSN